MQPTMLGYALIGLTIAEPRSGYALRKVFEDTPLGRFSSSPGSIYPALRKLTEADLLEQKPVISGNKTAFHPTDKGRRWMREWLAAPVTVNEVANDVDHALLRFAFSESIVESEITLAFLQSFQAAVETHLKGLNAFMASADGQALSLHGSLAMQNGIAGYQAHLVWAKHAIQKFENIED